jgi:hypothetical protein
MVGPYSLATTPQHHRQPHQNGHAQNHLPLRPQPSMDSRSADFQSSAIPPASNYQAYPATHLDQNSENSTTAPQQQQQQQQQASSQDARSTYSSSVTPTSESSAIYSNRTPTFGADQIIGAPRYVDNHRYQPTSTASSSGGMARSVPASNPPAVVKTDPEVSEDSTVPAPSTAFAPPAHYGAQYPPGTHAMSEGYQHAGTPNQTWRHDWSPYGPAPHQMPASPYAHSPSPTAMAGAPMVSTARPVQAAKPGGSNRKRTGDGPPNHPLSQVYSFVPIPGATQTKRPRRRYEEIERMYKCGWNGCEKAYGTLNHLNAHVTMQGHGAKRTPDGKLSSPFSPFFFFFFVLPAFEFLPAKKREKALV